MPKKHVKLTAGLNIDSSNFYQRTVNHITGETKIYNQDQPVSGTANVTITSKPLKVEHSCSSEPNKTEHNSTWTPTTEKESRTSENVTKKGAAYDNSALFE